MKLTVERDALHAALSRIARVVERKTTIPILAHALLAAEGDGLALGGTDLDMHIATHVKADIAAAGAVTAPAHILADIVGKLAKGSTITIEATADAAMTLRAGRARFTLQTLPAQDYANLTPKPVDHSFRIAAATFESLLARTQFAISSEETRFYLNGTFLHVAPGDDGPLLTTVATDGHRLARMRIPAPPLVKGEGTDMPGVIIPTKAVTEILRLIKDQPGDLEISLSPGRIGIVTPDGQTSLASKLIDGTFPDYQRVIPNHETQAIVDRATLDEVCDRVSTISSERGRAVKFDFAPDEVKLSVASPDGGHAEESIPATWAGPPIRIGFNARYMRDMLANLKGQDVAILLNSPGDPALLREIDTTDYLAVLMPMRV